MQKLTLKQNLQQKLSPQQIQFIKLLQIPTAELEQRIEEELEDNPTLEEGKEEGTLEDEENELNDDIELEDYVMGDDFSGHKMQGDGYNLDRESPIPTQNTFGEQLKAQLGFLKLNEREYTIGLQLLGSIERDGYIRRNIDSIINDLAFTCGLETNNDEILYILKKIQSLDPPGIGARTLQECLLIQLNRREDEKNVDVIVAKMIIEQCFEEFKKKHYSKILKKLDLEDETYVKDAFELIRKLNPKPGNSSSGNIRTQYLIPDFILRNNDGELELSLNSRNAPELKISKSYADMVREYEKNNKMDKKIKETLTFVKHKLESARWFMDAIKQRQQTLIKTMRVILDYQREFFLDGDETKLKPMILKDISEVIKMDISTVSRVVNSKSIQTDFGIFPLKHFFTEGISTDSGTDVSSREVKNYLKKIIQKEDKRKPLSDEKIQILLNEHGYNIARRTIAKYREQLEIPVARLRKEL